MSGNHYSKQVLQLEAVLQRRLAQLSVLEQENAQLKQQEWALQSCILGIEGSVAATRAVLEVEADPEGAYGNSGPCLSGDTATSCSTVASGESNSAGAKQSSGSSAAQNVLEALERKEQQVQRALAQMGCCGSGYSELYGVRLLRRATADPAQAVALLNTPLTERRQYVKAAMQKLGLLLPKYDSSAPTTSLGSAKERLHAVLDDLAMRILLTTLMDPPEMRCSNMLVNLETAETETYPEDYWASIAERLKAGLTDDQKAALKICWSRVKVNKAALTDQHSRLSARLKELQQQQQQQQQHFEELAAKLPLLQVPQYAQQMCLVNAQQQQLPQQQRLLSPSPASTQHSAPQQQLASPVLQQHCQPPPQQHVQGQQSPSLLSGQPVQQPQAFGSMQMLQMEEEIQEVERMLFSDLPGNDTGATTPSSAASLPGMWPDCLQQQPGTSSPEGLLSGLLQEQQVTPLQAGVLPQVQPQVCVLPAMQQQQQQQQGYLQQAPALPLAWQLPVLPQQPQLAQMLLQEQPQQQMCMLPPAPLQAPQQLHLLDQQQQTHLQQQQVARVHSHQSSMQQTRMSERGCMSVSASTHTAVSQPQPQQQFSAAAAAAGLPGPTLPAAVGNGSLSGAAAEAAAVAAAAAAAGVRGSFTSSAAHTPSGVEEVLLPVASKEQRSIEKQLLNVTEKIKLQHFCQIMQFHNTLSNKQMAELYVSCWPFLPDSLAVCEALDELGW